jgi:hypothetical protein
LLTDNEFTRILQWPGYRVYRHSIDEKNQTLELWSGAQSQPPLEFGRWRV